MPLGNLKDQFLARTSIPFPRLWSPTNPSREQLQREDAPSYWLLSLPQSYGPLPQGLGSRQVLVFLSSQPASHTYLLSLEAFDS